MLIDEIRQLSENGVKVMEQRARGSFQQDLRLALEAIKPSAALGEYETTMRIENPLVVKHLIANDFKVEALTKHKNTCAYRVSWRLTPDHAH